MITQKRFGLLFALAAVLMLFAPLSHAAAAVNEEGNQKDESNTYWNNDTPETKLTLTRRMALVGHNCMVSRLADGVEVGSGSAHMEYLCDEDLTNHYTLPSVANATLLAGSPIVGVKDMKHTFSKNTKAGFKISGSSSVLNLSLLKTNYKIRFYKDGKILKTSSIEQAGYTVLNLSLGDVNIGSDAMDIIASEQPEEDYDEIALVGADGISVDVVSGLEIYYAFVGDGEYTLTHTRIKDYDQNITVEGETSGLLDKNICDDDLTNGDVISAVLQLGSSGHATAQAKNSAHPDEEVFPAGTEAGFVLSGFGALKVAPTPVITLLDKDGKDLYSKAVSTTILGLSLGAEAQKYSIKAPCAFSGIKVRVYGVEVLNTIIAKYAFIVPEPTTAGHKCEMSPVADMEICNCDVRYRMRWDDTNYPDATWTMTSTTDNKVKYDASTHLLDFSDCDDDKAIKVVMTLKNTDGCTETVTINFRGDGEQSTTQQNKKETVLVNAGGSNDYQLGNGTSIGVNLLTYLKNPENILTPKLNDYASYFGGISIGQTCLCSIKKSSGTISDGSKAVQAGFVVSAKGSALDANVLKLMNVKAYKDGTEVEAQVQLDAITAKLIGSEDTHKIRYSVKVPEGKAFDELRLYSTGLLSANLSVLNIYYAYTADADIVLDNPEDGATVVSFAGTGATIDAGKTQSAGVANVGNGLKDITNCIDGTLTSKTTFPTGVKAATGSVLAIKLGRTATRNQQLVVVVNKEAVGLGVNVASAIVVKTYKTGVNDAVETYSDWSVLGANVISIGDKGYIFINPKADYDEVTITEGSGVSALNGLAVYGLLLRNDMDADGTPDAEEPMDVCKQDLVLQETVEPMEAKKEKKYNKDLTMYFQRTLVGNAWNSIILPVTLTRAQFANAFGSDALLSEADRLYTTYSNGVTNHVIGFKKVEEQNDGTFMQANTPYIIYVTSTFVNAHKDKEYTDTWDAGTIKGEIYTVDHDLEAGGVDYDNSSVKAGSYSYTGDELTHWSINSLVFKGSYEPHQTLKSGDYIFNKGALYHITNSHWMKGYRCWIEADGEGSNAKMMTFGFGDDEATGIRAVDCQNAQGTMYNLNGQKVDALHGMRPGIFIVGGKKVVVK